MASKSGVLRGLITLVFVGSLATTPLFAQAVIPQGATIDHAEFWIWASECTGMTVNLHRITADWGESSVTWNSFMGSYDPAVAGSFVSTCGWNSADITALVQAWVDGDVPNFGILLEETSADYSKYCSSEFEPVDIRPLLEFWYTSPSGVAGYVLIQRPGEAQDGVRDAYIWESTPNQTGYNTLRLYTGLVNGFEKHSLIRFHFEVEPETPDGPGTGTPGYWKNHPDAWPVDSIVIGGVTYSKAEAIKIMKKPVKDDMTRAMFKSLVAAKFNVLIGNDDSCIWSSIEAADAWLAMYPVGSGVEAGGVDSPWREGEAIHQELDWYNNGELDCADHRD